MITRYREYLDFLDKKLSKMFAEQKTFIKCKEGCAYCCKEGEYPLSELEYINLMFAYNNLDINTKEKINENIANLVNSKPAKFYKCPFLINDRCAVYSARAIICRTFGLLSFDNKGKKRIPFCVDLGLNYANVYQNGIIIDNSEDGTEPVAYNIDRTFLRSAKFEKEFKIFFGEDKPLIEWLAEDFDKL